MRIGFHTDAFNSACWSFDKCLEWVRRNGVHYIECGLIDGVSWIHGLGYQPHSRTSRSSAGVGAGVGGRSVVGS